jgi:hypothetical protein
MLTSLPLLVIDGAEEVVFFPAIVCGCQVFEPLTAQKKRSELFAPWPVMLTLLPSLSIDGWEAAIAAEIDPVETVITAAVAQRAKRRMVVLAGRSRADGGCCPTEPSFPSGVTSLVKTGRRRTGRARLNPRIKALSPTSGSRLAGGRIVHHT